MRRDSGATMNHVTPIATTQLTRRQRDLLAAHLVRGEGDAELGISVAAEQRGRGIGQALLERVQLHARNWGIDVLFMHCLAENDTMRHLARKQGMAVAAERGEASARVELRPRDVSTIGREFVAEHIGLFDFALKTHVLAARRLAGALTGAGASAAADAGTEAAASATSDAGADGATDAATDARPDAATMAGEPRTAS